MAHTEEIALPLASLQELMDKSPYLSAASRMAAYETRKVGTR